MIDYVTKQVNGGTDQVIYKFGNNYGKVKKVLLSNTGTSDADVSLKFNVLPAPAPFLNAVVPAGNNVEFDFDEGIAAAGDIVVSSNVDIYVTVILDITPLGPYISSGGQLPPPG